MGYLAYDTLNPRMYILACNVDAVVIQSTQDESKLMLLNNLATSQNSLEPNFTISASNEDFNINKNSNLLSSFQYVNDESIQIVDVNKTKKVIFNESDGIIDSNPGISFSNNNLLIQLNTDNTFQINQSDNILFTSIYNDANSEARLGIGIKNPEYALQVEGSIYSSGTIVASNLTIIGDTVTLDTITSNTEQMIITNMGDGPAIIVSQTGANSIAEFYDDGTLCMIIDDNGLVGIGITEPTEKLDISGNAKISGDISSTNLNITGDIYYNGEGIDIKNSAYRWKLDDATSNLYYTIANIGIGTSEPSQVLHVIGDTIIDGIITTNNNDINAGTGTITASIFDGTASNVANYLSPGDYLLGANYDGSSNITWDVNATSDNTVSTIVSRDSSGNFSAGTITATTFSGTLDGTASNVANFLSPGNYLLGANYDGSSNITWGVNATSDNTVSTIVSRDSIGNFSAGTITANLTGNASTASIADKVSNSLIAGNYISGSSFDGSSSITWNINASTNNNPNEIVVRDSSSRIYTSGIGIGTTSASVPLHVIGNSYLYGTITTNNNNINAGTGTITASVFDGTASNVANLLSPGDYLLGADYDGSSNIIWTINATSDNTVNTIVSRDSNGDFSAGTITATLFDGTASNVANYLSPGNYLLGADYDGSSNIIWNINAEETNLGSTIVARDTSANIFVSGIGVGTATVSSPLSVIGSSSLVGNVGIGTTNISHSLTIHSSESVLTVDNGKIGINKTIAITPSTDIEIRNSSDTNYTGILLTNNGNVKHGSSIQIKGVRYDNSTNIAYSANLGLSRQNANALLGANIPLGLIHFGGNHTVPGTITASNLYTSYIGAISEDSFTTSSYMPTSIILKSGTSGYNYYDTSLQHTNSNIAVLHSSGNFGIGVNSPSYKLDVDGDINFNGILYQNGSAFVSSEWTCNLDGSLYYIDNVGIGTDAPTEKLHVEGNIYSSGTITASNLTILGDYVTLNTITSNTEQVVVTNDGSGPALQVTQTGEQPIADFYDDGQVLVLRIADGGYIGIGTDAPTEKLHVEGNIYSSGTITATTFSGTLDGTASNVEHTLSPGYYVLGADYDGSSNITWNINATSDNTVSTVVARDASGNFSAGTITATLDGTASNVEHTLSPGDYLLGADYDGSSNITWNINATSDNTVSTIVARDESGNFSAGTITATLNGTASNVEHTLSPGDYVLGADYDGSSNITWNINATSDNTVSTVVARDGNGDFAARNITANLSGHATSADQVTSTLTIGLYLTGDNFNGSANSTIAVDATDANTASKVVVRDASGNFSAGTITATLNGTASNVEYSLSTSDSYLSGSSFDGSSAVSWSINAASENTVGYIVARDSNGDFAARNITANLSGHATSATSADQVTSTLTRGTYLTGSDFDGSSPTTWAVDATSTNTIGKVVVRDSNGDFSAGTITATLNGTASNVEHTLSPGDYVLGADYDGSSNITWNINATSDNTVSTVVARDGNGDFAARNITANLSGHATSADQVTSTLTIGLYLTGDNFNGSANSTIAVDATDANTASKVVVRDASGNFSAGTITATLNGTASNVEYSLSTSDSYLSGSSFDGSSAVSWSINAASENTVGYIVARDSNGDFAARNITANLSGHATSATSADQVTSTLTRGTYLTGSDFDGSSPTTWAVDATSTNTIGKVVVRDSNGDFAARNITTNYVYTSNIIFTSYDTITYIQVLPIEDTIEVPDSSTTTFQYTYDGIYKTDEGHTDVYVNGHKLAYIDINNNDYTVSYSNDFNNFDTTFTIILQSAPVITSIVDIKIWPQYLDSYSYSNQPINFYQNINTSSEFLQGLDNDIYYTAGYVGIGTTNPNTKLDIIGEIKITAPVSQSKPAIYIENFSATYGEIAVESGGRMSLGQWTGSAFTEYLGISGGSGNIEIENSTLQIYGNSGTIAGTTHTGQKQVFIADDTTHGWWIGCQDAPTNTDNELCFMINENGSEAMVAVLLDNSYNREITTTFTGQHRCFVYNKSYSELINYEGLIVSANKNKFIKISGGVATGQDAITISETLPVVDITNTSNDKAVFGVISTVEDPDGREEQHGHLVSIHKKELGDTRAYINSVGEGAIWIININGDIESGDYITSSIVPGYGMKQDDDLLHNYTVAKITMDCDFNPIETPKLTIKKQTIIENGESKLVNDLDNKGNIQWINVTDDNGNIIYEKEYKIRYVNMNGNIITEEEYTSNIANNIPSYKAAFVGCTYHCG